ncbi:MAG: VIT and VWA domain-containing protein [Acidobacteriia bacterium]|nr:VIT and VWA domain-containing protein [Terriglobia bacterium]
MAAQQTTSLGLKSQNAKQCRTVITTAGVFVFLLGCILPSLVFSQGIIFPRRCPGPWPMPPQRPPCVELGAPLPVKSITFATTINNQVARTHIEQVFENPNRWAAEGVFYFPIPESASIEEFAMWTGGKRIVGELVERDKARQTYNEIVRRLRDPGLLEYVGKNLFQARVFPIAPGSEQKIEIRYSQILKAEQGTVKFEYPLGVGHNALPQPIGTLAGKVEITSNVGLKNIYSPTHALEVNRKGENRASASFELSMVKPPQDFILYYALSDKEFGLSLLTYREKGKDGFFIALLSPRIELKQSETVPKDIVFVLDTSGSMSEEGKITKAREALKFGIRSLHPSDYFNIIHFASEEHLFETELAPANSAGIERAVEYVSKLEANGGTDINSALLAALKMFREDMRPHFIVFLTDGLPTVGEQSISRILTNAQQANPTHARLFTVGVGYDVNTHLLDPLAEHNHGVAEYIAPKEDLEVRVSNIFTKVNSPVLTNLKLDLGDVKVDDVFPRVLPDLFKGSQLVIVGRYTGSHSVNAKLEGEVNSGRRMFALGTLAFPSENSETDFIPRLWAIRKVGYLMDQIRLNGETKEVKNEIVELATRYGIATPYTSFLITEEDRQAMRPVPMGGVVGGAMGGPMSKSAPSPAATMSVDMAAQSGSNAVQSSVTLQRLKAAERAEVSGLSSVRHVHNKTFILKEGVWVDSEYNAQNKLPEVKMEFGSEEYFKLAVQIPEAAEYFSLGKKVRFVLDGKVYDVTSN